MTERPPFYNQLNEGWDQEKFLCVGLDADTTKLPKHLLPLGRYKAQKDFLFSIIDATAEIALAYKPNIAFFEDDPEGEAALQDVTSYIHDKYPLVPVIVDAKRGDILNTNTGYANSFWKRYKFDATTVHSYLGNGTYPPFLMTKNSEGKDVINGKGIIAMCKTSNPDAPVNQDLVVNFDDSVESKAMTGEEKDELSGLINKATKAQFYIVTAYRHGKLWKQNPNIGIVVGATFAESFIPVRKVFDGAILIPGIGTQGGDLAKTLLYAPDSRKRGMIINSSSGIIFASHGRDYAEAAGEAAKKLHTQIQELRAT